MYASIIYNCIGERNFRYISNPTFRSLTNSIGISVINMALLQAGNGSVKLSMSVQEMSMKGDEPPPEYIVKDSKFGAIESSPELGQIPIIDVNLFSPSSIGTKEAKIELDKLRAALSSSGCIQVFIYLLCI